MINPKQQRGYMGPSEPNEYNDGVFPEGCLPMVLFVAALISIFYFFG